MPLESSEVTVGIAGMCLERWSITTRMALFPWDLGSSPIISTHSGLGLSLGFHVVAGITSLDILGYIARESWPPVVACDELQGFPMAWVACCWCVMLPFIGMDPI